MTGLLDNDETSHETPNMRTAVITESWTGEMGQSHPTLMFSANPVNWLMA